MRTITTLLSIGTLLVGIISSPAAEAQDKSHRPHEVLSRAVLRGGTGGSTQAHARSLRAAHARTRTQQAHHSTSEVRGGAPVNDLCANATALTVHPVGGCPAGAVSGDNSGAAHDGSDPSCDATSSAFQDVWYSFNSGNNATVIIDVTAGTIEDVGVELLQGSCAGSSVYCNFGTSYTVSVATNTNYRLRLFSNNDFGLGGTFDICLSAAGVAPPNDLCADANIQTLNVPGAVSVDGDNTGATDTEGIGTATAWEAFTVNSCADVTVSYCGTDPAFGNVFLSVVDDCALTTVFDADPAVDCGDGNLELTFHGLAAGTYWYPVLTEAGSVGPYTIGFSAVACGTGGPANDLCSSAIPVNLDAGASVDFSGTTVGATSANDMVPGSGLDVGGDTVTVWHAFTTSECTDIVVSYCGTATLPTSYWAFLSADCPAGDNALFFSAGNFTDCSDGNATIFFYGVPAGTYYLPVRGEPSTEGPYLVNVSATACASAGPYCEAGAAFTGYETISNVNFAGIDNASTGAATYEDFTDVLGVAQVGMSYPIIIDLANSYASDEGLVWIDFDQSDSFEPGELVFTGDGVGPYSGNITIPGGAAIGQTRMRIRLHDTEDGTNYQNTPNYTPCDTSTFGQVEDYTITITSGAGVYNDECADATPVLLTPGGTIVFTGNNIGCTDTEGLGWNSAWEAFTINECMDIHWDFCGSASSMLVYTDVWAGCPLGNFSRTCGTVPDMVCPDQSTSPQATATGLPAGTYYITIPYDQTYGGDYQINVTGTACTTPAPVNDECGGAIALTPANTCTPVSGTTAGATRSLPDLECAGYTGTADDDVWYSFTATTPGGEIHAAPADELDVVIQLYSGVCGGFSPMDCADGALLGGEEVLAYSGLTVGTTYYYRVYGYYLGQQCDGFFTTCVTQDLSTGVSAVVASPVRLRPNPAEGQVTIECDGAEGNVRIEILDVAGRLVQSEQRSLASGGSITLDLSGAVSAGMYTLRVTTPYLRAEERLLVK